MDMQAAGPSGLVFVLLGVVGFVGAFCAMLAALVRPALALRIAPLVMVLGVFGVVLGQRTASRGLAHVAMQREHASPAEQRDLEAAGEAFAKSTRLLGLQAGMLPLFAGVTALAVALVRLRREGRA